LPGYAAPAFGLGSVKREAGSRRIAVDASVAGRDLGSAAADVRARLAAEVKLAAGYFRDVGGKVESQARASAPS
jgi:cobalt-zinc-cadmium resistance protein CzcA